MNFTRIQLEPSQPSSLLQTVIKLKKGKVDFCRHSYGRFLSINSASTASPIMSTTNRPAIAGTKYVSAIEVGEAVGTAVAPDAADATKAVEAEDP